MEPVPVGMVGTQLGANHLQPIRGTHQVPDAVLSGKQKWFQTPFATKVAYGEGIRMHVWTRSAGSKGMTPRKYWHKRDPCPYSSCMAQFLTDRRSLCCARTFSSKAWAFMARKTNNFSDMLHPQTQR